MEEQTEKPNWNFGKSATNLKGGSIELGLAGNRSANRNFRDWRKLLESIIQPEEAMNKQKRITGQKTIIFVFEKRKIIKI